MLPEQFVSRMKPLLGDGFDAFIEELEHGAQTRAFRLQADACHVSALSAFSPEKLSYTENGYRYVGEKIGNTPMHHAGGIYVQDPGAMAALCAVKIPKGAKIVDLCAAPGGKSSQAIYAAGEGGFLLANEYVPQRAKITVGNFERLGIRNAVVTSLDTSFLKGLYENFFDLAIVDAPCSGEGMFRKTDLALTEWSVDNIRLCAERQAGILDNAASLVKEGGKLVYSTCTYAPEENEMTVAAFLSRHAEYELVCPEPAVLAVSAEGLPAQGLSHPEYCRRFYPHVTHGEGQFVAVLQRTSASAPKILYKDASSPLDKATSITVDAFLRETLTGFDGNVRRVGDHLVLPPDAVPTPPRSVFSAGVVLGELKGKTLVPHHQFVSAYGGDYRNTLTLTDGDPRLTAYLRGEQIPAPECASGFAAVRYRGLSLGGGKLSSGMLNNHYPKGLRLLGNN
ncbi:MAG: hypothetical protein MJ082_03740 [Clostridia bacterium]|nr:hypothetical protein [Clostridia bacterium]